jgi:hypothetical protein
VELRFSAISSGLASIRPASSAFIPGSSASSLLHMFTSGLWLISRNASMTACSTTSGGGLTAALLR